MERDHATIYLCITYSQIFNELKEQQAVFKIKSETKK